MCAIRRSSAALDVCVVSVCVSLLADDHLVREHNGMAQQQRMLQKDQISWTNANKRKCAASTDWDVGASKQQQQQEHRKRYYFRVTTPVLLALNISVAQLNFAWTEMKMACICFGTRPGTRISCNNVSDPTSIPPTDFSRIRNTANAPERKTHTLSFSLFIYHIWFTQDPCIWFVHQVCVCVCVCTALYYFIISLWPQSLDGPEQKEILQQIFQLNFCHVFCSC